MRDEIHEYLAARSDGASAADLLDLVFAGQGRDSEFGHKFLRRLLAEDPRVREQEPGHWVALDDHLFAEPLATAPFVVVDLETTGQRNEREGVTEIGAIRVEGGREVGRFEQLINPGRPIPPFVAKLTGITDAMVADAPRIAKVMGPFAEFAEGAVLVAHNAAFDAALLDRECRRILGRPLGLPSVCTVKLAQHLLPDLKKTSLDAMSVHFNITTPSRHRAMGDAETTAVLLEKFIAMEQEAGRGTVADLLAAQGDVTKTGRLSINVSQAALEDLPRGPGVFAFHSQSESPLLVEKADDVRGRVTEYFLSSNHASKRQLDMLSAVRSIEAHAADCDLEAALLEAREVRRLEPEYNRSGKHLPKSYFFKLATHGDFPRAMVTTRIKPDGSLYLGPLRGRALAEDSVEMLAALFGLRTCPGRLDPDPSFEACQLAASRWCSSPCDGKVDAKGYRAQVERFEQFVADGASELPALLASAPFELDQSVARRFQATARRLERFDRRTHWLVNSANYLALEATEAGVFVVPVISCRALKPAKLSGAEEVDPLLEVLAEEATSRRGRRPTPDDVDAASILSHWYHRSDRRSGDRLLEFDPADSNSVAALGEDLRRLLADRR